MTEPSTPTNGTGASELVYNQGDDETTAEGVVAAVSELIGVDPEAMEPLYDAIDPEALNTLCDLRAESTAPCRVSFRFNGCAVTAYADGRIEVSRLR